MSPSGIVRLSRMLLLRLFRIRGLPRQVGLPTLAALLLLAASAWASNALLFRQEILGTTALTADLPRRIGSWTQIGEAPASAAEIRGLETRDIVKRAYSDGKNVVELVVAYIAHSNRKSAHAQEACLRGSGALVSRVETRRLGRTGVKAKSIALELDDRRQQVYYWYKIGNVYTADYLISSLKMFLGGLAGSDRQGAALVRLLTQVRPGEGQADVDGRLEEFAFHLIPELERHLP